MREGQDLGPSIPGKNLLKVKQEPAGKVAAVAHSNRTVFPKESIGGQPSRVATQARHGQAGLSLGP